MSYFIEAFKKYIVFSGRTRRREFWYFILFYYIFYFALAVADSFIGTFSIEDGSFVGVLSGIFILATLLPSITVGVRRLHDTNRSGWWILLSLIPLIGTIVLIFFWAEAGTTGDNRFGTNPKTAAI